MPPRDQTAVGEPSARAPSPALEPPPGNPRFPLFDGLRALAVLGVLALHTSELTGRVGFGFAGRAAEIAGSEGLVLFFVISGFLLYRPYVAARARGGRGPSVRRYARRRALRILPGYWVALTLLAVFPGITGVFTADWWRYYGFLQLYSERTLGGGIPVAWTLCVEVTFYVALPVWALAAGRLAAGRAARGPGRWVRAELAGLGLVAAGGLVVQVLAARHHVSAPVGSSLAGQCLWFAIGMALASASVAAAHDPRALRVVRAIAHRPSLCWLGSAAAFGGLMALVPAGGLFGAIAAARLPQPVGTTLAKVALAAACVSLLVLPAVFGEERRGLPRRLLATRPVVWLGVVSYSFYLLHLTLAQLIALPRDPGVFSAHGANLLGHVHTAPTLVLFVVTFAATGVLATIGYRAVELPFLRRKEPSKSGARASILTPR